VKILLLVLAFLVSAGTAFAQPSWKKHDGKQQRTLSQEERQQMREEMRDAYRERGGDRRGRPDRPRHLTPEEREKLRRDVQDANKDLRR